MSIIYNKDNKIFYLHNEKCTYAFHIGDGGYLQHLHFGVHIEEEDIRYLTRDLRTEFAPAYHAEQQYVSLDVIPQEYPIYGMGDFRETAVLVRTKTGNRITNFKYQSHRIVNEKPQISNMPSLRGGETLIVELRDESNKLCLTLFYTLYEEQSALVRRAVLKNEGTESVDILKFNSFSLDMNRSDFDKICLQGGWAKERGVERTPLSHGIFEISSTRGSSSHHLNPFLALCDRGANEDYGEVYGFNLVYSGSYSMKAQVDQLGFTRVGGGINEKDFCWKLGAGENFEAPEVVMVYSANGLNGMSQQFHRLYRDYLINPNYVYKKRPIVLNNWESTYYDFTTNTLCELIEKAQGTGIDTFVLDDGWFGNRNSDTTGLGDWFVNTDKLQGGLTEVIDKCHACGMNFGLWFEPEMISEDSELYRKHPDWCVQVPDVIPCKSRNQLVLDFANPEVVEYIKKVVGTILADHDISYVKWDMNRNITECYSLYLHSENQQEFMHRYILGVYDLAGYLTSRFPQVFFEGCSGGGGRFDPAMLYYFPQIWTSDNTDAVSRAYIQYGTSLCYPLSAMSGHVSICPNHQNGRVTPIKSRMDMASFCATGYELNLHALTTNEFDEISSHLQFYNEISELILDGDLYRLQSPFEGNYFSEMVVSRDKRQAAFLLMKMAAKTNDCYPVVKFKGLDRKLYYKIDGMGIYSGSVLMHVGLRFPNDLNDYETICLHMHAMEQEEIDAGV